VVRVLVLYYSVGGRTESLAKAVAEGVSKVAGATASLKRVDFATVYDFISCDAVAFGSPNYFSYMTGLMKDFFDKALGIREKVMGKPAFAFTSGGGDSDTALLSLDRMISSFRMEKISDGVISSGIPTKEDLDKCRKLGETLAKAALKRTEPPKE